MVVLRKDNLVPVFVHAILVVMNMDKEKVPRALTREMCAERER